MYIRVGGIIFKTIASHFVLATLNLGWRKVVDTTLGVQFDTLKVKPKKICDIQNSFYSSCTSNKSIKTKYLINVINAIDTRYDLGFAVLKCFLIMCAKHGSKVSEIQYTHFYHCILLHYGYLFCNSIKVK